MLGRVRQELRNAGLLLTLLLNRPREFGDRLGGLADLLRDRAFEPRSVPHGTVAWRALVETLDARFGGAADVLEEPALREVEDQTRRLLAGIRSEDPYTPHWAADSLFARLCYLTCRLVRPRVVVETGVAYGVSSAFILKALEQNGRGTLHSVDLPPLGGRYGRFWGIAVPDELKGGWRLHRGPSRRVLPGLIDGVSTVDLFVHDSLHTRRNMRREFDTVWPRLRGGGVILADDVERNRAFDDLRPKGPALWRVVRDREENPLHGRAAPVVFGMAVK